MYLLDVENMVTVLDRQSHRVDQIFSFLIIDPFIIDLQHYSLGLGIHDCGRI